MAGYSNWTPWLEGTICDVLFFKTLMSGRFFRPNKRARWKIVENPENSAYELYKIFPLAMDLKFSLYFRDNNGNIISTLDEKCINQEYIK